MKQNEIDLIRAATDEAEIAQKHSEAAQQHMQEAIKNALAAIKSAEAVALNPAAIVESKESKGKHLNDYAGDFDYYSGKASEINRSLGLAGIAVIWIFRQGQSDKISIPIDLLKPLWFLVGSLSFDLLQYILGFILWGSFYQYNLRRWKNKKLTDEEIKDMEAPYSLSLTITAFFFVKIIFMIVAYAMLLSSLYHRNVIPH